MMSLSLGAQLIIECDCCNSSMENHERGCPRLALEAYVRTVNGPECPVCHDGKLMVNLNDFLECNSKPCRRTFTRSSVATDGSDPDTLQRFTVIDYDRNEHYPVLLLKRKGKGAFKYKLVVKNLRAAIKETKELRRLQRRQAR